MDPMNPRLHRPRHSGAPLILACLLVAATGLAPPTIAGPSDPHAPDTPQPGSVEAIRRATTEEMFLNAWIDYVPESSSVPSPTDYLGHIAGAPGELSDTTEIYGYLRALAAASPRVGVETV